MNEQLFIQQLFQKTRKSFNSFPDKKMAEEFADALFNLLFASYESKYESAEALNRQYDHLKDIFSSLLIRTIKK